MNFFDSAFQTPISAVEFGICDNGTGGRAYTDCENKASWIATVNNPNEDSWIFTAIDKGVVKDSECFGQTRCDGMLTRNRRWLILVELKDQSKGWISDAIEQLEGTIRLFQNAHASEWAAFIKKRAYACNRRHPVFNRSHKEDALRFFQRYQVRLHIEASISLYPF